MSSMTERPGRTAPGSFFYFRHLLPLTVGLLSTTACTSQPGADLAAADDEQQVVALSSVGADSMESLMRCWQDAFEVQRPDVSIDFVAGLSADGALAMMENKAEFSPFAREFFPNEVAALHSAFDTQAALIQVAGGSFANRGKTHALAIYVNRDNPLASLSLAQLRDVFAGDQPMTWGELGLSGEWQSAPINTYGMLNLRESGNPPGIVNFLRHRINKGEPLSDSIMQLPGDAHSHALQQIVDAVASDRFGIGYSGFGFGNDGSKPLAISDDSGAAVAGSPATVSTRRYPLSRSVYMAIRPALEQGKKEALYDFMQLVLSLEGQECVRNDAAGFFPLPGETREEQQTQLKRFFSTQPGTARRHGKKYWTDDGRVRVVGYNDMDKILTALSARFTESHPDIRFDLVLKGTRTAPPALMDGSSAFAPMGAEFSDAALAEFRERTGSEPLAIRVAHASLSPKALSGPLAFFVHVSNPLRSISLSDAKRIFAPQDGDDSIQYWGELGVQGDRAVRKIKACGLAPQTALATFLTKRKFDNSPLLNTVVGFRQSSEAVELAAADEDALCFAAYIRRTKQVRALAVSIKGGAPAYLPTEESVISGQYPLDRYLYIYVRNPVGIGVDPLVREYLRLALSPAGQEIIASGSRGYLPLNAAEVDEELAKLSRD